MGITSIGSRGQARRRPRGTTIIGRVLAAVPGMDTQPRTMRDMAGTALTITPR
jgi:hypothetical protein